MSTHCKFCAGIILPNPTDVDAHELCLEIRKDLHTIPALQRQRKIAISNILAGVPSQGGHLDRDTIELVINTSFNAGALSFREAVKAKACNYGAEELFNIWSGKSYGSYEELPLVEKTRWVNLAVALMK